MTPASEPEILEDGTYATPKSKHPKGYDWCTETGLWVPSPEKKSETVPAKSKGDFLKDGSLRIRRKATKNPDG